MSGLSQQLSRGVHAPFSNLMQFSTKTSSINTLELGKVNETSYLIEKSSPPLFMPMSLSNLYGVVYSSV